MKLFVKCIDVRKKYSLSKKGNAFQNKEGRCLNVFYLHVLRTDKHFSKRGIIHKVILEN